MADPAGPATPESRSPFVYVAAAALVLLTLIGGYWYRSLGSESTDDAQVEADVVPLAVRTGGLVLEVMVKENSFVKANDIIMVLDPNEQQARVAQAEGTLGIERARLATAQAQVAIVEASAKGGLESAKASVGGFSSGVKQAQAQVLASRASLERARADARKSELDLGRAKALRAANAIAAERLESAQAAFDSAHAASEQAAAQLDAAEVAKRVSEARVIEAQGRLGQSTPIAAQIAAAHAAVDLAAASVQVAEASLQLQRLQFDYLRVRAPRDGIVSRMHAHTGQLLAMGQAVAELVPTEKYVVANFKETQIEQMRGGQSCDIVLDAFPSRPLRGRIESLSSGTGARFALLPPDNASGNFVKVVQRVPVRVAIKEQDEDIALRAGLSATVVVHLEH